MSGSHRRQIDRASVVPWQDLGEPQAIKWGGKGWDPNLQSLPIALSFYCLKEPEIINPQSMGVRDDKDLEASEMIEQQGKEVG